MVWAGIWVDGEMVKPCYPGGHRIRARGHRFGPFGIGRDQPDDQWVTTMPAYLGLLIRGFSVIAFLFRRQNTKIINRFCKIGASIVRKTIG